MTQRIDWPPKGPISEAREADMMGAYRPEDAIVLPGGEGALIMSPGSTANRVGEAVLQQVLRMVEPVQLNVREVRAVMRPLVRLAEEADQYRLERNEARTELADKLAPLRTERDELRAQLQNARQDYFTLERRLVDEERARERAVKERDEARDSVEAMRAEMEKSTAAFTSGHTSTLIIERCDFYGVPSRAELLLDILDTILEEDVHVEFLIEELRKELER